MLQDHTLDSLGPPFEAVYDQYGTVAARSWYTTQERTELCRALLYAVVLSPTVLTAATVAELLGLLESKAARLKQAGAQCSLLKPMAVSGMCTAPVVVHS